MVPAMAWCRPTVAHQPSRGVAAQEPEARARGSRAAIGQLAPPVSHGCQAERCRCAQQLQHAYVEDPDEKEVWQLEPVLQEVGQRPLPAPGACGAVGPRQQQRHPWNCLAWHRQPGAAS